MGALKVGQYARTTDGIGLIFGREGDSYQVVSVERDEERGASANELTSWSPQNGERVTEIGNEDSPVGIVVEAGEGASLVVWKNLRRQASWANSGLEPAWD